ncbi:Zn(2)-C6 fungal-type domain-containing protein [Trichoderma simmonsii]|uniref:Zn(2)-C6 fungal-type domain-containing protein n=1 Tax=Trichoderma simmonsii TaxID=1491479 RepID=A0A8G0LJK7_9HYPO|nr:Zn(2)-C6 fungal-type domain-containing protein [Trichoderma simmonsii]
MQKNACLSCRMSKLRCSLETFAEHNKCKRCFTTNNECVFKTVAPRQRRKRTDTRVTALEQRLAELQASLDSQRLRQYDNGIVRTAASRHVLQAPPPVSQLVNASETAALVDDRKWLPQEQEDKLADSCHLKSPLETVLASNLLSTSKAIALFNDFVGNVLTQYPIVTFSSHETFDWLRRRQPTLLFAAITAACRASDPVLFRKLHLQLRGDLSEQVMVRGHKSVELVQAILVMVEWYDTPDDMVQLNFYTWIQIAGLMVRELGLWPWSEEISPVEHTAVEWRTSFAAYLTMSIAAVSLRRPMSMVWTESMRRGLDAFDKNSVNDNDRRLVAWVRLQMIAEGVEALRIKAQVSLAQPGADAASPVDQHTISSLESRFGRWRDAAQPVLNGSLRMHFFYCRIKFYELAVTCSPTRSETHTGMQPPALAAARDMAYIRAIMSLIQSSHSALDTLVLFDIATYRRCPTVTSIRALYALQELITVWKSVYHQRGYLSEFVNEEVLALSFYARQTEEFFKQATGAEGFVIPKMALNALANVLLSLGDMKSHKRQYRVQQPELVGQEKQQGPARAPRRMANDLDVILVIDLGNIQAPSAEHVQVQVQGQGQEREQDRDWDDVRSDTTLEWPPTSASDGLSVTLGDVLLAPELEAMTAPDSVIDPGWLLSE